MSSFYTENIIFLCCKTSYLNAQLPPKKGIRVIGSCQCKNMLPPAHVPLRDQIIGENSQIFGKSSRNSHLSKKCKIFTSRPMEQHIFCIFIDYRGHHRKSVPIYNVTWVKLKQNLWFCWTKYGFLNTTEWFKHRFERIARFTLGLACIGNSLETVGS